MIDRPALYEVRHHRQHIDHMLEVYWGKKPQTIINEFVRNYFLLFAVQNGARGEESFFAKWFLDVFVGSQSHEATAEGIEQFLMNPLR